jgi:hypothetical protein
VLIWGVADNSSPFDSISKYPDFSRIATPGKSLIVGRIYERLDDLGRSSQLGEVVQELIVSEETVAILAYQAAAGVTLDTAGEMERRFHVDRLERMYQDLGLASGPKAARELIRLTESAAVSQILKLPGH